MEIPDGFVTTINADIRATVTCHYPCVPECTREHDWHEGNEKTS